MKKSYLKLELEQSNEDSFNVMVECKGEGRFLTNALIATFLEKPELFEIFSTAVTKTINYMDCEKCPHKDECNEVNQKCNETGEAMKHIIQTPPNNS